MLKKTLFSLAAAALIISGFFSCATNTDDAENTVSIPSKFYGETFFSLGKSSSNANMTQLLQITDSNKLHYEMAIMGGTSKAMDLFYSVTKDADIYTVKMYKDAQKTQDLGHTFKLKFEDDDNLKVTMESSHHPTATYEYRNLFGTYKGEMLVGSASFKMELTVAMDKYTYSAPDAPGMSGEYTNIAWTADENGTWTLSGYSPTDTAQTSVRSKIVFTKTDAKFVVVAMGNAEVKVTKTK